MAVPVDRAEEIASRIARLDPRWCGVLLQLLEEAEATPQHQQQQQQQQEQQQPHPPMQVDAASDQQQQQQQQQEAARVEEERRLAMEQEALEKERQQAQEKQRKEQAQQQRADLATVTKAIAEIDGFPEAARSMLLDGLPHAFTVADDGKSLPHAMQASFIKLVASALEDANAQAAKSRVEACTAEKDAQHELQTCEKDLAEADEAAKVAAEGVTAKTQLTADVSKVVREAENEHNQAERAGQAAAKAWQQIREERKRAADVAQGSLHVLATGAWEDEDTRSAAMKAVVEHLQAIEVDNVLATAAPLALEVRPAKRARFDNLTVDTISAVVNKGLSALDEKLAAIAPEEEESRAELLGLWAIADVARDQVTKAERSLSDAQATSMLANATLASATTKLSEQKEMISLFASQQAVFEAKVADCKHALAALERLKAGAFSCTAK